MPIDYFPNRATYQRLHEMATVLERFCARAPEPVTLDQLAGDIDLSRRTLKGLCSSLNSMGMILAADGNDQWSLVVHPSKLTLDDVWRAASFRNRRAAANAPARSNGHAVDDIDMLISQALLAINQSISAHLKKFQLDSVRISQCGFWSLR
jgi:DNA-binding IscR family transcriptional regulator